MPPATGNMPPSSACTSASSTIATVPISHEMIAAGPAATTAFSAPKSQPDPMMEPTEAHIRPMSPTSRRRPPESVVATGTAWSTFGMSSGLSDAGLTSEEATD